jgi:hypothetical protein
MTRLWVCAVASLSAAAIAACAGSEPPPSGKSDAGTNVQDGSGSDAGSAPDALATAIPDSGAPASDASSIIDQCNPITQDCGSLDGGMGGAAKCSVQSGPAMCIPANHSDLPLGASCQGFECATGLACVAGTGSSTVASCVKICDIDHGGAGCDTLGADWDCRARINSTNWGLCVHLGPMCDPISQAPCPMDQACTPLLRTTGQYEFRCKAAGTQGDGQACGAPMLDCIRGFVCVLAMNSTPICREFCARDNQCPMNQTCVGTVVDPPFHFCKP